jgi:cysteine-rich CWC protein
MKAQPKSVCPVCNGANDCAPARTGNLATPCWCAEMSIGDAVMGRVPEHARNRSCVCSTCAGARHATLPKAVGDLT